MNELNKIFNTFLSINNIDPKSKFLIAVSGGIDSMVCLHVAKELGLELGIAHVNFQLRANESALDSEIVEEYCKHYKLPFHLLEKDAEKYAFAKKLSIQEAARNIRYSFFDSILTSNKYDYIITAHHLEDNIETLFLHLNRRSGLKGLSGIPSMRDKIIRPFLSAQKKQIIEYASQYKVPYREDSSNKELKYDRNYIRNKVLPSIVQQFPDFYKNVSSSISLINEDHLLLMKLINEKVDPLVKKTDNGYQIEYDKNIPALAWYHYLKKFGFNNTQIEELIAKDHQAGKKFISANHILYIDREYWIINKPVCDESNTFSLKVNASLNHPLKIACSTIKKPINLETNQEIAFFDKDKLTFPLQLRKWLPGDRIKPIGMKGSKKVSDLLVDLKIPIPDKKRTHVLLSDNKIIWVIGKKVSNEFKVDKSTKNFYKIVSFGD